VTDASDDAPETQSDAAAADEPVPSVLPDYRCIVDCRGLPDPACPAGRVCDDYGGCRIAP
jgi:hypothetical protein